MKMDTRKAVFWFLRGTVARVGFVTEEGVFELDPSPAAVDLVLSVMEKQFE